MPSVMPDRRPDQTIATTRGALRVLADLGYPALAEVPLRCGRRADLLGIGRDGTLLLVEVKSCEADYRADSKWPDYLAYADAFAFAVPPGFPLSLLNRPEAQPTRTGIIVADGFDGALIRPAPLVKLNPARRKAMLGRLARLGAQRLMAG
ncbi:MAG: MmcB family DNA repair protein [Rhodothalassiaceae bacterium]